MLTKALYSLTFACRQPVGQWLQALTQIHDSYQDGVDGAVSILKRRRQAAA